MECAARYLFVLLVFLVSYLPSTASQACDSLEESLETLLGERDDFSNYTLRRVEQRDGNDSISCLNAGGDGNPPPCLTLEYALQLPTVEQDIVVTENLVLQIGQGTFRPTREDAIGIVDYRNVALIGSGKGQTNFECGRFGADDAPCSYQNYQIRDSINVVFSGITFTRCGPITSAVYISTSELVVIKDCEFRDNLSPPLILYNTSPFVLQRTSFTGNHPQKLNESITDDTCYFSGGVDNFFLDNRTSSGGLSQYSEDEEILMVIEECQFTDNEARPDDTVSLPRQSEGYGHGAAANIRLSSSSYGIVCIRNSWFESNTAEAQAGAVAITLGGTSTGNDIELLNSTFNNNTCTLDKCTGGAVGIDFFADTKYNKILIKDSNFTNNQAVAGMGGAISLSTTVSVMTQNSTSDALVLENCTFEQNEAFYDGTAVGVFSLTHTDQVGLPLNISDCHFRNNMATRGSVDSTALTTYRVLLTFTGNSSFVENQGGAISLLSSRMDVRGKVVMDKNVAVFGAGIAMTGRSLLLLFEGAKVDFTNNMALDEGAGMYVEYTSSDFVLAVLNRGCFIQYFSQLVDIPPDEWDAQVRFINNTARRAGAAIYASDMSRCKWLGSSTNDTSFIFNAPDNYTSPFLMQNNTLYQNPSASDASHGTDASTFIATTDYGESPAVGYGEVVSFHLNSKDQYDNFRQSVWTFSTSDQNQTLGATSSNETVHEVTIPGINSSNEENYNINATFSFISGQTSAKSVTLQVTGCHPGYTLDMKSGVCKCNTGHEIIVSCDAAQRYFYVRDGYWVGQLDDNSTNFTYSTTVPGFLNCTTRGELPGCEIKFDKPGEQCAKGRKGKLCGDCEDGYGVTFDLRFCQSDCEPWGIILFIVICVVTVVVALLILFYDLPLPDELKGFAFFAQVIGLIFRNGPYLVGEMKSYHFFDFLFNILGFSLPFPLCPAKNIPAYSVALLGFVPPLLAITVAIIYILFAKRSKHLSERQSFNGFHLLFVFVYKYFLDTSFIFISYTSLGGDYVFIYQGTRTFSHFPQPFLYVIGLLFVILLGFVLPSLLLCLIYRPGKYVQAADALTRGLKSRRRYRWYGVWDIWRRVLFVAANLFISATTRNIVLFIHCLLILTCLSVVCVVKPYKKTHINVSEAVILFCLFGATLAILDDDDVNIGIQIGITFGTLPFIYAVVYIAYRVGMNIGQYAWRKAEKSESEKVKAKLKILSDKYYCIKESKPAVLAIKMTDIVVNQEGYVSTRDTNQSTDCTTPSKCPQRLKSYEKETTQSNDSDQELELESGPMNELLYRGQGISASELREPLLEED